MNLTRMVRSYPVLDCAGTPEALSLLAADWRTEWLRTKPACGELRDPSPSGLMGRFMPTVPPLRQRSPVLHRLMFLSGFALAGAISTESWPGLAVAPEHRCSACHRSGNYL